MGDNKERINKIQIKGKSISMENTRFKVDWTVARRHEGILLREYLRKEKNISKSALADIKFHGGLLLVNGKEVTVRYQLKEEDAITIHFPPEKVSDTLVPEYVDFEILYEDEHFIIVNKPSGIPTIPSHLRPTGSLAHGILYYYRNNRIQGTFHAVNRLDRDTSGIVVVAKHRYAHSLLSIQQRKKTLAREYVALIHGVPSKVEGVIKKPIGRKEGSIVERTVTEKGQYAETHYKALQIFNEYTLVSLVLKTGRTHQIRVHMSSIGHPLLGDDLYGGMRGLIGRQALHSNKVQFFHPFTEQILVVKAPITNDIKQLIECTL
jgi:23S rRNA pseudouridine1911/1915/1917 synthase